jgi:hypothetical protein
VPFGYENDCGGFGDVVREVAAGKLSVERNDRLRITRPPRTRCSSMAHPLKHAESSAKEGRKYWVRTISFIMARDSLEPSPANQQSLQVIDKMLTDCSSASATIIDGSFFGSVMAYKEIRLEPRRVNLLPIAPL